VRNGRLVVDAPTLLPEGTVLDLVIDEDGCELDEKGRIALHAATERGFHSAKESRLVPADQVMLRLLERSK
jgi:hypothetical protein